MGKILIVDDEPTIRELFDCVFTDAGHSVLTAANGKEALEVLRAETPDFMVVDVSMPVMTGRDFIVELGRRARTDRRLDGIHFCVMTGENFMEGGLNRAFAERPGFICYFPKMVPPETVLAKAEETLGR
jgi:CheY-like chemotaxis protein